MNAPKRLTLLERLLIAKAAHAAALERGEKPREPAPRPRPPPEEDRRAAIEAAKAIERAPLHVCGIRMVICVHCLAYVCRAPGHQIHVCGAPEFSQVAPP